VKFFGRGEKKEDCRVFPVKECFYLDGRRREKDVFALPERRRGCGSKKILLEPFPPLGGRKGREKGKMAYSSSTSEPGEEEEGVPARGGQKNLPAISISSYIARGRRRKRNPRQALFRRKEKGSTVDSDGISRKRPLYLLEEREREGEDFRMS